MNTRRYTGLALICTALAGCGPSKTDFNTLRENYNSLNKSYERLRRDQEVLDNRVSTVETTPLADKGKEFYRGQGLDDALEELVIRVASNHYRDPKSLAEAARYTNRVAIIPLPKQNTYYIMFGYDDGDNKSTDSSGDKIFPDRDDKIGFIVSGEDIPNPLKDRLLDVQPVIQK